MSLRDELRKFTAENLKKSPNVDAAFENAVHHMKEAGMRGKFSCRLYYGSRILSMEERSTLLNRLTMEDIEVVNHPALASNDPRNEGGWTELSWK